MRPECKTDETSGKTARPPFASMHCKSEPLMMKEGKPVRHIVPFHTKCDEIAPGYPRGGCVVSKDGWRAFLRVRTTDRELDTKMIDKISNDLKIPVSMNVADGVVTITLEKTKYGASPFYEISAMGKDIRTVKAALKSVDSAGMEIVVEKEIAQDLMTDDVAGFMREMMDTPMMSVYRPRLCGGWFAGARVDASVMVPGPEGAR